MESMCCYGMPSPLLARFKKGRPESGQAVPDYHETINRGCCFNKKMKSMTFCRINIVHAISYN